MTPFVSNESAGVYFWTHDATQFSSHPHPALEHHCEFHGWWSDGPCLATHGPRPWRSFEVEHAPAVQLELFEDFERFDGEAA